MTSTHCLRGLLRLISLESRRIIMYIVRNKVVLITARCSLSASNCASQRRSSVAKSAHQMHRTSASMHICRFNHLKANVMQVVCRRWQSVSAAESVKQWLMARWALPMSSKCTAHCRHHVPSTETVCFSLYLPPNDVRSLSAVLVQQ